MKRLATGWILVGAAVACLLVVPPVLAAPPNAPADEAMSATYVGSEECASCHGDLQSALVGTPHGTDFFAEKAVHGCETCHGPGSEHVDDPEIYSMRVADLTAEEQSATCQSCHSGRTQFYWEGGVHEERGVSCLSCHSVHDPMADKGQLNASSESEQCYSCHQNVRAETWKTSHHPIREGQMECSDCHNPHGSMTEGMIVQASVNDLCYSCHADKRGPFLWEHPPVREDCMSCHESHGSNHMKLQTTSVPFLCQQCHSNTRHPGTMYDAGNTAAGSSPSNRMFNRACMNCHNAVHGSNHPSSPYLSH